MAAQITSMPVMPLVPNDDKNAASVNFAGSSGKTSYGNVIV